MDESVTFEGVKYDAHAIHVQRNALTEQLAYRAQNVRDFMKVFEKCMGKTYNLDENILYRMGRLAGTTILEGAFLLDAANQTTHISGDWCEYGVAHGRTSAFLAQLMLSMEAFSRNLWLYDSFEGLPKPGHKDVLLHDIFHRGSMEAYAGEISIPEVHVRSELASVREGQDFFRIKKGWITPESLSTNSPEQISLAFLDMDFYQSTFDVLFFLIDRMPKGGIAVVDDYGFFSSGVETAVNEIMSLPETPFALERPFGDKFVILTRR